jgi:hypothetical protein
MTEHTCHAVGCGTVIPPRLFMCPPHWARVPELLQQLIWRHYREGQEVDKDPSVDYIATAFVAISAVALQEGKPLPTFGSQQMTSQGAEAPVQRKMTGVQSAIPYPD